MEEEGSQEILLSSLGSFGVSIPENISSVKDLTPTALVSICRQSLDLLEQSGASSSSSHASLSDSVSMAEKLKICNDIGMAFKNLGYIGDVSYHKFLYPSEEDLYKLVRFLVERLSESPTGLKASVLEDVGARQKTEENKSERTTEDQTEKIDNEGVDLNLQKVEAILKDLRLKTELPESINFETEDTALGGSNKLLLIPQSLDEATVDDICSSAPENLFKNELFSESREDITAEPEESEKVASLEASDEQNNEHAPLFEEKTSSLEEQASKYDAEILQNQENWLQEEFSAKTLELQHFEKEFALLKAATEMAFDESHPVDFYIKQLNEKVDARKRNIVESKLQWDAFRNPLEEKRRNLMDSLYANKPEAQEKLHKLREVELEIQSVYSEIRKWEEKHLKISADLEKQPKAQSRRSYIERIKEITKNSGKLDADIEQILKETRELQLESNSIQERLNRTYAVADEIIFREAKKDPVGRQVYRLLASIHEIFEQISEKILATDRVRRDVADYEKKLAAIASRSVDVDQLQADLDAIKKENEFLETSSR